MTPHIRLRPVEPSDDALLYALFKASRPELGLIPLPPEQVEMIYRHQFEAQRASYRDAHPESVQSIVLSDETPVGMIWVNRTEDEHCVMDVIVAPEHRNRGIGSELVKDVISGAKAAGVPVRCSVAVMNPGSLRFHLRLGFQVVGGDDVFQQLEYDTQGT